MSDQPLPKPQSLHTFPQAAILIRPSMPALDSSLSRVHPNRELTIQRASESRLPGAHLAKGASNAMRGICFALSNRELNLLEPSLTYTKQTTTPSSNRELSTDQCDSNFIRSDFRNTERFKRENDAFSQSSFATSNRF
jgi:hypothetical protein